MEAVHVTPSRAKGATIRIDRCSALTASALSSTRLRCVGSAGEARSVWCAGGSPAWRTALGWACSVAPSTGSEEPICSAPDDVSGAATGTGAAVAAGGCALTGSAGGAAGAIGGSGAGGLAATGGDGAGCGRGAGGASGAGGRAGGSARRKQFEWVDVALARADPDTEMNVREVVLRLARRARLCDDIALHHAGTAPDAEGSQMSEGRLVVARRDGHGEPVRRHPSGKCDFTGNRRSYRRRRHRGRCRCLDAARQRRCRR